MDLSFSHTSLAPELLDEFHANDIVDCVTSPLTYCAATVGLDGEHLPGFISDLMYLFIYFFNVATYIYIYFLRILDNKVV
ncbi:unnamed protein product [Trichobilharzia regenti]|nr:unnamed protein product [Trichobilharzia regenti]